MSAKHKEAYVKLLGVLDDLNATRHKVKLLGVLDDLWWTMSEEERNEIDLPDEPLRVRVLLAWQRASDLLPVWHREE